MTDIKIEYTDEQLRDTIEDAVAGQSNTGQCHPRFYVIGGSHMYGFPDSDSDIDIRGFHTVPAAEYAVLDSPKKEITMDQSGVDLRSYELRHFGQQLAKANFNIMEMLFEGHEIMNGVTLEIDALRSLVSDHLPLDVTQSYTGMAKSNYHSYLDASKPSAYDPSPKKYLYVYRALLGAWYVYNEHDICADVCELAETVPHGSPELVDDLIEAKQEGTGQLTGDDDLEALQSRAVDEITDAFNRRDVRPGSADKDAYRSDIDDWMMSLR